MPAHPQSQIPSTPHVTTEPQRLALEQMSEQLITKLNKMVEEQEKRAREFAQHRHSLSSLPTAATLPEKPQLPTPPAPQVPPISTATYTQPELIAQPQTPLPPLPTSQQRPRYQQPTTKKQHPQTRKKSAPQQQQESEGISAGTIIFVLAIIFVLLKGC